VQATFLCIHEAGAHTAAKTTLTLASYERIQSSLHGIVNNGCLQLSRTEILHIPARLRRVRSVSAAICATAWGPKRSQPSMLRSCMREARGTSMDRCRSCKYGGLEKCRKCSSCKNLVQGHTPQVMDVPFTAHRCKCQSARPTRYAEIRIPHAHQQCIHRPNQAQACPGSSLTGHFGSSRKSNGLRGHEVCTVQLFPRIQVILLPYFGKICL
jgi:hypothetical protein